MKQIKLEVGNIYRSRQGKEVKILEKDGTSSYPYQGSNGKRYIENGKWDVHDIEHPEDLIEEVPETRHTFGLVAEALTATRYTFDIPEGVKKVTAKQEGNRIIVEMVPEKEPKPGDVPEIERIREWVWANLKSDLYAKGDVAEAIDGYLKHKEGEK